jgi:hypothetical protein
MMPLRRTGIRTALLALGLVAMTAAGCGEPLDPAPVRMDPVEATAFAGGYRSADALVHAAINAAVRGDLDALWRMRVTREEYEELVWPELPDREVGPLDFFWSMMTPRARKGARNLVSDLRGVPVRVESVRFTEEPARYPSFTIHKYPVVALVRTPDGATGEVDLITGIVEWNGIFKILSLKD